MSLRVKSPTIRLLVESFAHACSEKNTIVPNNWHIVGNLRPTGVFFSQRDTDADYTVFKQKQYH